MYINLHSPVLPTTADCAKVQRERGKHCKVSKQSVKAFNDANKKLNDKVLKKREPPPHLRRPGTAL